MKGQLITCSKCKKEKLFTLFYSDKGKLNGRQSWCRACVNEYNRNSRRDKRRLKIPYGIVAEINGRPYAAVFVAPHGFTLEATRQGIESGKSKD